jgi:lipopolysaccharide biosynthesis glycosyltransferase
MSSIKFVPPIVLASDEKYAMPLSTTLRSIVEVNECDWPLNFHILSNNISPETQKKIFDSLPLGSAAIRWVEVDLEPFEEFSTISHISKVTYARFLIPNIFPDTVSKALYLDADILVLDSLRPIWETDLQESLVGAVLDGLDYEIKNGKLSLENFPNVQSYFNAGVLLINLDRWRKEEIPKKALEYLSLHPNSRFSDQDALNVVCDGRWKKLDARWNFVDFYQKVKISNLSPRQRPGIVHFATWEKPWDDTIYHVNASFYDSFRSRTRFPRTSFSKFKNTWPSLKYKLKQYSLVRTLWSKLKCISAR